MSESTSSMSDSTSHDNGEPAGHKLCFASFFTVLKSLDVCLGIF